jgi:flavin-dependent dehydrogenase
MTDARLDFVVAGGGPAGAAAALTLARAGRRVLLADTARARDRADRVKIGETLPPAVQPLLRDLDLWRSFLADEHLPSHGTVTVWGSPRPGSLDFIFDPNGSGWHLDRMRFDRRLRGFVHEAGVDLRDGRRARVLGRGADGTWKIGLASCDNRSTETVECRMLIDATGRHAGPGRWAGARRLRSDRTVAAYAIFMAGVEDHDARTVVEAARDGWWYTALIPGKRRVVAYLTDGDLLPAAMRTPAGFCAQLSATTHVRARIPDNCKLAILGAPRVTVAEGSRLQPAAGQGWLALGDAALAFDPLSSQGIFNALFTGILGAQAAAAQLVGERSPTRDYMHRLDQIWAAYEHNRRFYYELERRWTERPFWARRQRSG